MTPEQKREIAKQLADEIAADTHKDVRDMYWSLIKQGATEALNRAIPDGYVVVPVVALEQAHMRGQAEAGIDPSWSNAQVSVRDLLASAEAPHD